MRAGLYLKGSWDERRIATRASGKLLHVADNNQTEGGSVVQFTANGTQAQQWRIATATCSTTNAARVGAGRVDLSGYGIGSAETPDEFRLWPNPARDYVQIDLRAANGQAVDIALTDLTGRVRHRVQVEPGAEPMYQLVIDPFATGLYFVSIKTAGKEMATIRLLLSR